MKFRTGSAAFSTVVSVACLGMVGAAGYSFLTGNTVCSLLGACGTAVTSAVSVAPATDGAETSRRTGAISGEAALVAISDGATPETAKTCDGATATAAWSLAEGDAIVIPTALVTDAPECEAHELKTSDAPECAAHELKASEGEATILNAADAATCAAKAQCEKGDEAKVVNAALVVEGPETCGPECGDKPCAKCAAKAAAAPDADVVAAFKPVNATCPGSGEPVDPAVVSAHQGFTVGFCCGGCQKKFDAKSDDEKTAFIVQHASLLNDTCPTCPTMKPSETSVSLFNGFAVGFCGDHCKSTFDTKDDAGKTAYIASIVKPVNAACPFSGEPIDAEAVALHRGFAVGFCGDGCQGRFTDKITAAERDAMVAKLALNAGGAMVVPAANVKTCGEECADKECGEACNA